MHVLSVVPEMSGEMGELTFIHMLTGWIPVISYIKYVFLSSACFLCLTPEVVLL